MRAMLAWQHGANLGHFSRLAALGHWLAEEGAVLIWAVPAAQLNHAAWGGQGNTPRNARIVAPAWDRPAPHAPPVSFAGVLEALGYADPDRLATAVQQWWTLFDRLRIERLVVDYAPAALLAAVWAGLPTLHLTNGFDAPPADAPPFDIRAGAARAKVRHEQSRLRLNQCLAEVGRRLGISSPLTWEELLTRPMRMYDCVPEADPYAPRPGSGIYVGPVGTPVSVRQVDWPRGDRDGRPRVFVYLRDASCKHVLKALTDSAWGIGAKVVCFWPGVEEADADAWRSKGVDLVNEPVALEPLLPDCDMVVSYGAAAVTCRALLAGVPQLILPIDAEKDLIARRIEACGAAMRLPWQASAKAIAGAAKMALAGSEMRKSARAVAARHAGLSGHARAALMRFLQRPR
jgi:UDP:flavonoid glycosyltransferase YjiC (YdhE family)